MTGNCIVVCVQHLGEIPWGAIELNYFLSCFHGLMYDIINASSTLLATSTL